MRHRFVYRVFSLLVDLDELPGIARNSRVLSHNRFGLLSIDNRDHGPRDGNPLKPWALRQLGEAGIEIESARVFLLCFPRILGYVFNPLSVYWVYDRSDRLRAVLYEVKNTFGGQHAYAIAVDGAPGSVVRQSQAKRFYVSPFIAMRGDYDFRLAEPEAALSIAIVERDAGGPVLVAAQRARRVELSDATLVKAWLRHPLMTLKVILAIHFEAWRLWRKGATYHPPPDRDEVASVDRILGESKR